MLYGKVVNVPLGGEDLTMKPEDVLERITPKTKAIILNSPSIPQALFQAGQISKPLPRSQTTTG